MKLQERNGIAYPAKMKFRSWIIAGPPGSGKSYLVDKIRGWPGEICLDITMKHWWRVEPLAHRPREIHFALPFKGSNDRYAVYDEKWTGETSFPELDTNRIRIPKKKKFILAPNWRARFVFDFILPPPEWLLASRQGRTSRGDVREVDRKLTLDLARWQVHVHWQLAQYFHRAGLQVMLRPFNTARPYSWRVVNKIMQKEVDHKNPRISPELDWSLTENVRDWAKTGSPNIWQKA